MAAKYIIYVFTILLMFNFYAGNVALAAQEDEAHTTITVNNPPTREIDQMAAFSAINVTSSDKDRGYHEEPASGNLVVSANANWKLQAKVTNNLGNGMEIKYANGSYVPVGTNYADLSGATGQAAKQAIAAMNIKLNTDWNTPNYSGATTDLYIKITSSP